jgi:hypothetical protein
MIRMVQLRGSNIMLQIRALLLGRNYFTGIGIGTASITSTLCPTVIGRF